MMEQLIKKYHSQQYRNGKIPYTDHLSGVKSVLMSALSQTGECSDSQLTEDMCNAALGEQWLQDFYAPILYRSKEVLAKTVFPTYPRTAEVMRNLLAVVVDLLEAKRRNALNIE